MVFHILSLYQNLENRLSGVKKCGQLGLRDKVNRSEPIQISGLRLESITEISCGSLHSMALTSSGQNYCSQLGDGNKGYRNNPGLINLARKFIHCFTSQYYFNCSFRR